MSKLYTVTLTSKAVAKKRSLTKTSQLFQGESSYKLFGWNKVAAGFSAPVNWKILELWTLYLTYVIRSAGEIFWRTYTYIYIYISEISIEHDWESASLARWIITSTVGVKKKFRIPFRSTDLKR